MRIPFWTIGSVIGGVLCGAAAAAIGGVPLLGVAAVALAAGAGAGGASLLSLGIIGGLCNGKGPGAGYMGLAAWALAHVSVVPVAATAAGMYTANQFKAPEAAKTQTATGRTISGVTLVEDFKGACDGARIKDGAYVLPKGCKVSAKIG